MSGDGKIKIKDIEGAQEDVVKFLADNRIDVSSYLNTPKDIKVSFWAIAITSALFLMLLTILLIIKNETLHNVACLFAIALAFLNVALIYMSWRNKVLTGIIAMGELVLFCFALNIYTPKEIVKKMEEHIERKYP